MEVLRTLLFVPGNRPDMQQKARSLPADALCLDLEDSVPWAEKAKAREIVWKALPGFPTSGQVMIVRINSLSSGLARDDVDAVVSAELAAISVGKVESAGDVAKLDELIASAEQAKGMRIGHTRLLPWVETPRAVLCAYEIATSARVLGLSFGADDFTASMGVQRTKEAEEQSFARASVALAAKAASVLPLDTPWDDFRDMDGLVRDTEKTRQVGFTGRWVIHPSQIEPVNRLFSPSATEIEWAKKVLAAFEEGVKRGVATVSVEGTMVDIPGAQRARNVLALAEAIARKQSAQSNLAFDNG